MNGCFDFYFRGNYRANKSQNNSSCKNFLINQSINQYQNLHGGRVLNCASFGANFAKIDQVKGPLTVFRPSSTLLCSQRMIRIFTVEVQGSKRAQGSTRPNGGVNPPTYRN